MMFVDFNLVISMEEKKGGDPAHVNHMELFRDTLHRCGLHDLGFEGSAFTWCNKLEGEGSIMARLDRFVGNVQWKDFFPLA